MFRFKKYIIPFFALFPLVGSAQVITGPEQDCEGAISVCQSVTTQNISYQGSGNISDIPLGSCLDNGETNTVWYIFTIADSGLLEFSIIPQPSGDYDFALYDLTNASCSDIPLGLATEVRCNYAFSTGPTGLQSGYTGVSEGPGGHPFCRPLMVTANQTYALVVDNFHLNTQGYVLDFSTSTADILDYNAPKLTMDTAACQTDARIKVSFSEPVKCNTLAADGSNFMITGPSNVLITGTVADECASGDFALSAVLNLDHVIDSPGIYHLIIKTANNGGMIEDNCGNAMQADTVSFRGGEAIDADFSYSITSDCVTDTLHFINTSVGNISSIKWKFPNDSISFDANTSHIFDTLPNVVQLNVANGYCEDSIVKSVFGEEVYAFIGFFSDYYCIGDTVLLNNNSGGNITDIHWDFGDGTTSTDNNPFHVYQAAGYYQICLTVSSNCLYADTFCIPAVIEPMVDAGYTYTASDNYLIFTPDMIDSTVEIRYWFEVPGIPFPLEFIDSIPLQFFPDSGGYEICQRVFNFCDADTFCDIITLPINVGIYDPVYSEYVRIYPNPTTGNLNVVAKDQGNKKITAVSIINIFGEIMFSHSYQTTHLININLDDLPMGVYLISVSTEDQIVTNRLILAGK